MSAFAWPNGFRVAVSLSFDDARPSQLDTAIPILNAHGIHGTFYVTLSRVEERVDDWLAAIDSGHEIGNHSLRHSCSGNFVWGVRNVLENYTLEQMEAELSEASARIRDLLGVDARTFAYPCGQTFVGRGEGRRSYVPAVARQFLAGRGFREEFINRPAFCDLAIIGGTEFDGLDCEGMIATVEKAAAQGLWVAFAAHDVGGLARQCTTPEDFERFCAWCSDPANGVWVDTVEHVATYVRDNRSDEPGVEEPATLETEPEEHGDSDGGAEETV